MKGLLMHIYIKYEKKKKNINVSTSIKNISCITYAIIPVKLYGIRE